MGGIKLEIKETGYLGDGIYLWKTMILETDEELPSKKELESLNVNLVLKKFEGVDLNLVHYTSEDNYEGIVEKGILLPDLNDENNNLDLGIGIYCIEEGNLDAELNIEKYLENYEEDYVSKFTFNFTGEYLECIYGEEHEGYILLAKNVPAKDIIEHDSEAVQDLLWY